MKKRTDIQCIRAIAIIAVVLYHVLPNIFENGFLGVDVFFVLSGFLMSSDKTMDIVGFYYRRARRILPLYYFVCFLTTLSVQIFLIEVWWNTNHRYYLASLCLVTNQLIIHDSGDYFLEFQADGSSLNAFIHFWSLCVEIQFYILVPFILIALRMLKSDLLRLLACSVTTFIGMILFHLINAQFAFNFMPLRLWQFSTGFMAYYYMKSNFFELSSDLKPSKIQKYLPIDGTTFRAVLITCLFMLFVPIKMNVIVLRILLTLCTGVLLTFEAENENLILSNRVLPHIGDLSYIIYLIHWPVIIIIGSSNAKSLLTTITLTFIISSLLYYTFERVYLTKLKSKLILLMFIGLLMMSNAYLYKSVKTHDIWRHRYPEELQSLVDANQEFFEMNWEPVEKCDASNFEESFQPGKHIFSYCKYRGNGTKKIMVIGNSYTANLLKVIKASMNDSYVDFQYAALDSSYGIYSDNSLSHTALEITQKLVAQEKPDVLMIISRFSESIKKPFYYPENDEWIQEFNKNIKYYEQCTKRIYILGAFPLYRRNSLNTFIQYLIHKPEQLESLHLKRYEADLEMKFIRKRFNNIKCESCQIIDLSPVFATENHYLLYDRSTMLSYIDNAIHITKPGLELFEPYFANVANDIFNSSEYL